MSFHERWAITFREAKNEYRANARRYKDNPSLRRTYVELAWKNRASQAECAAKI